MPSSFPRLTVRRSALLSAPERWRFVGSALPIEEEPVRSAAYARWADAHVHAHRHREILFCIEGETCQRFGERDYPCRPGTIFLFDADERHARGYPPDKSAFVHLWIMVLADDAIACLYSRRNGQTAEQRSPPQVFNKADRDDLVHAWRFVESPPAWAPGTLGQTVLRSAVFALMFRAIENWMSGAAEGGRERRQREIVAAVQRHIETHLAEAEDLDALAHVAGYSKFYLIRMFKACTGQTVHGFIDQCRQQRARVLLDAGTSCKTVAGELGFFSPAAFSNWRRRQRR
jgi:AraC-like DNA-binding protein/quercetin dioxygenase-like cupin family protein